MTPQLQQESEGKEKERRETYTKTHSDRRCQLRKDIAQNTVRLDGGEEEESEVTQEARAGMRGGEKEKQETQGQEVDEEKMKKAGERGGKKRKGDATQGSRVTNENWVLKKPAETDPSAWGKSPSA